jgi:glyoxylase-like metal-dependent hydrolase (beta-lactamase superfamily II)
MLVVSNAGAILVDAPPSIGAKLLDAVHEVAPGAKIVAVIYSHAHIDHIGYAGEILKTNPSMTIVAHEETRKLLARAQDPARPLPTQTFNTQDVNYPFVVGDQTLQLQYPGPNHEPGNMGIYHPGQKVLMLVDVVFPGWMMWRRFGVSQDIPGYFDLVKTMNSRWDFNTLIAGHVGRAGTKADVTAQLEFMTDLHNAAYEGLTTIKPGETVNPPDVGNAWAYFRDYVDRVTNHCVDKVSPKWASKLAAYDVWIYDQCMAMEQSLRIDGPSIK